MAEPRKEVSFDLEKLNRFKLAYKQAVDAGQTEFKFDGDEYLVGFAKYVIEHLNNQFGIKS